jgi:predicted esterase
MTREADANQPPNDAEATRRGFLRARPHPPQTGTSTPPPTAGLHALGLAGADGRDGLLYVPTGYDATHPATLLLYLHGAGGSARGGITGLLPLADAAGLLLLAPDSRLQTWDVIMGGYGADVAFIERALAHTFARYAVNPARLAIGGFSDGASYALSLGLINGDLFTHIVAFSPGFMAPTERRGQPGMYLSHGVDDAVLPIERCGRRLARQLERDGYAVNYHEFAGGHVVPPEIAQDAIDWLAR